MSNQVESCSTPPCPFQPPNLQTPKTPEPPNPPKTTSNCWKCERHRPMTWHEFLPFRVYAINERSILDIQNPFFITFSITNSGVHHKKNNCESNQVISKVQQVISVATKAGQLYPKNLMLTVASVIKKQKIRKGNGGWGDRRDVLLCLNMTLVTR